MRETGEVRGRWWSIDPGMEAGLRHLSSKLLLLTCCCSSVHTGSFPIIPLTQLSLCLSQAEAVQERKSKSRDIINPNVPKSDALYNVADRSEGSAVGLTCWQEAALRWTGAALRWSEAFKGLKAGVQSPKLESTWGPLNIKLQLSLSSASPVFNANVRSVGRASSRLQTWQQSRRLYDPMLERKPSNRRPLMCDGQDETLALKFQREQSSKRKTKTSAVSQGKGKGVFNPLAHLHF